jgi:hypothetical protein
MQVAASNAAPQAVTTRDAGQQVLARYSATIAASAQYLRSEFQVDIKIEKQPSPLAVKAMRYIAESTRLRPEDKDTLIRLVAIVDEFADGDEELMRKVLAIAKLMEMGNAEGSQPKRSFEEVLKQYREEREKLGGEDHVSISVKTEILSVQVAYGFSEEIVAKTLENPSISAENG